MRRCGDCGSREIKKVSASGMSFPWKDFPSISITNSDLKLLKCAICGNVMQLASDSEAIDGAIVQSIIQQTRGFIDRVILKEECTQVELARNHLGITPEHLSVIKSGKQIPSFQLFTLLKILALTPNGYKVSSPEYREAV